MAMWNTAAVKDAMGMTAAESKQAAESMKASNENVAKWLEDKIREIVFGPGSSTETTVDFKGSSASENGVRITAMVSGASDERFAALTSFCEKIEAEIAYPEIRMLLKRAAPQGPSA